MAAHERFTWRMDIEVYFCDPRSPWQRGSNENTKRLLRQYMPKGIDILAGVTSSTAALAGSRSQHPTHRRGSTSRILDPRAAVQCSIGTAASTVLPSGESRLR